MHMADALLSPAVAGTMYACSSAAAVYSVKRIRKEDNDKKVPVMGVMGAFVFAAQMINFTIPRWRASCTGGKYLEYGILWLFYWRNGNMEAYNRQKHVKKKDYCGIYGREYYPAPARGFFRDT